jgi:hypothetical protein
MIKLDIFAKKWLKNLQLKKEIEIIELLDDGYKLECQF